MDTKKIILGLMVACGDECRINILEGKHNDVSVVMNYLEVLTMSSSWKETSEKVKKIWYENNPQDDRSERHPGTVERSAEPNEDVPSV